MRTCELCKLIHAAKDTGLCEDCAWSLVNDVSQKISPETLMKLSAFAYQRSGMRYVVNVTQEDVDFVVRGYSDDNGSFVKLSVDPLLVAHL